MQVEQNGIAGQRKSFRHSSDTVVLGSAMLANNEIEPSNPLQIIGREIQRMQDGRAPHIVFHTDACQAAPYLPLG